MIEKPEVGMQCFIIVDLWEVFCPVPVTIIAEEEDGGPFVARWQITEEYFEDYDGTEPHNMFLTEAEAVAEIEAEKEGGGGHADD